jgi:flavin-binding protein dodecin
MILEAERWILRGNPSPQPRRLTMAVAKVIEISAASGESFEDAIRSGLAKAGETVRNIKGAWVNEQSVAVSDGQIAEFRVDLKVTFVLD